jgi:murein DD-endopeptidase MepM/ murein hydrolase activator NlpD
MVQSPVLCVTRDASSTLFRGRVLPRSKRYTIAVIDGSTGTERRFRIPLWPCLGAIVGAFLLPLLIGLGARWSSQTEIQDLTAANVSLLMENESYREATGQLASQIAALQSAIDDLGIQAAVDPAAGRAMSRLPPAVRSRAIGGGTAATTFGPVLGGLIRTPETAFGVLRDVLGVIEARLNSVRSGVQRRQALALATPSMWPVTGWLTSTFGGRHDPFTGASGFHPGLDISAPHGEPVLATADGVVSGAAMTGNYGNLITLDHEFGIVTKYGHLSRFAVITGQKVVRGEVIGYVGSTGRSTSPHLHYEIWINDQLTNPMKLLAGH